MYQSPKQRNRVEGMNYGKRVFILHLSETVNVKEFRKILEQACAPATNAIKNFFTIKSEEMGIIDVSTNKIARKLRELYHGQTLNGKILEVKIMGHRAKVWVGRLCPAVSNEYLKRAFETFGAVERARVVTTQGGKSKTWGFVEFEDTTSARKAVDTCDDKCFMLTRSGPPVEVRFWEDIDMENGIRRNYAKLSTDEEREVMIAPRMAQPGAFEYDFAARWKRLAAEEERLKDQLKDEIMEKRRKLLTEHRAALDEEENRRRMARPNKNYYTHQAHQPTYPNTPYHQGVQQAAPPYSHNVARIPTQPAGYTHAAMPVPNKKGHPWKKNKTPKRTVMPPPPTNSHNSHRRHHPYR